jgi:hypothetical protein
MPAGTKEDWAIVEARYKAADAAEHGTDGDDERQQLLQAGEHYGLPNLNALSIPE